MVGRFTGDRSIYGILIQYGFLRMTHSRSDILHCSIKYMPLVSQHYVIMHNGRPTGL